MQFDWLLAPYTLVFLGVAVFWRTYRVWRITGVNALRKVPTGGLPKIISTYFQLSFVGAAVVSVLALLPAEQRQFLAPLAWAEHSTIENLGWVILIAIVGIVVVAQIQMGAAWRISIDHEQTQLLQTSGIFQYSRNPIFVSMRGLFLGAFLVMPNAFTLLIWVVGDLLIQLQVQLEEDYLHKTFGTDYAAYQQQVRRWL